MRETSFVWVGRMRWRIGNPKQKDLRRVTAFFVSKVPYFATWTLQNKLLCIFDQQNGNVYSIFAA